MTLYTLNLFDLFCTLWALRHGATELNPFIQNVPFLIFHKVVDVGLFCWVLHLCKARRALKLCMAAYVAVNLWHIINIFLR